MLLRVLSAVPLFFFFFDVCVFVSRENCPKLEQEEARRAADEAHRAFAAYEGDLPTLLRVYEGFLKVRYGMMWCGVIWCTVVWCGVVWYGYGMVWYGMV